MQLLWKARYIDSVNVSMHLHIGMLCIGARRCSMHPGVLAAWQQPGMTSIRTCPACSSSCAELGSAMPMRKGVNTGYSAAVQECAHRISQWAYALALKSRARPLKVPLRLARACGRARPPGSRPAGGAERCQTPCGTSRCLRRHADAANRSAGVRRDGFLCGLVSNETYVRRCRLQCIAPCWSLLTDSVSDFNNHVCARYLEFLGT